MKEKLEFSLDKPNYYIFIAADADKSLIHMPSAYKITEYRLSKAKWGVTRTTRCIKQIKPEDKIMIYVSGYREKARRFIAAAKISSKRNNIPKEGSFNIDSPTDDRFIVSDYFYELSEIQIFKNEVPIKDVKDELELIRKGTKYYGVYLQGGIKRISQKDYNTIYLRSGLKD